MHKSQFIKGFITCWTLVRTLTKYISVFLQHVEPLFALVWLPSAFVGQAAAAVPVANKICEADEHKNHHDGHNNKNWATSTLSTVEHFSTAVTLETGDRLPL